MGLETGTYINDLQATNPTAVDGVNQGDDHLRLIKSVLQNTFLNASRAYQIPGAYTFSTNTSLTKSNGEGTIYCNTGAGAVTFTLPSLVALDAGWKINFIKTSSDTNPMFIKPTAGTINSGGISGLAQARRCIPGVRSTAIWDGSNWFITRVSGVPIGSMIDFFAATLPAGYEWPSGQTLASASTNYPEYNSVNGSGVTPDVRGYACIPLDNLGGTAAGRLPNGFISGSVLGSTGGIDGNVLVTGNLPPYTPAGSISVSTTINWGSVLNFIAGGTPLAFGGASSGASVTTNPTASSSGSFSGTAQGGTSTRFSNLQPSIMLGKILVVE